MDYLSDIKPLELLGLTNQQIADRLSSFTRNDISLAEVENFLDFEGLASRNPITGNWEGSLVNVIGGVSQELSDGVSELFVHLNKPRSINIATTQEEWATKCSLLLAGLVSANVIESEQSNRFIALGGGLRYGVVSEVDVAQSKTDYNIMLQREEERMQVEESKFALTEEFYEAYNTHVASILDSESPTKDEIISALRSCADMLEV